MWKRLFMQLATVSLIPLLVIGLIMKSTENRNERIANEKEEMKGKKAD